VWKSKFYGAFVLNHRVVLHAIDATPARWRGDADSSPLDGASTAASSPRNDLVKNYRVHPTHWLISTQVRTAVANSEAARERLPGYTPPPGSAALASRSPFRDLHNGATPTPWKRTPRRAAPPSTGRSRISM
jgi:hypothetical protein